MATAPENIPVFDNVVSQHTHCKKWISVDYRGKSGSFYWYYRYHHRNYWRNFFFALTLFSLMITTRLTISCGFICIHNNYRDFVN